MLTAFHASGNGHGNDHSMPMFRYREYICRSSSRPSAPTTSHVAGVRSPFVTVLVDGIGSRENFAIPDRSIATVGGQKCRL